MSKVIFLCDMNSFFASVEQVVRGLKGKPVIVGGNTEKRTGIVIAASVEAKKYMVLKQECLLVKLKLSARKAYL